MSQKFFPPDFRNFFLQSINLKTLIIFYKSYKKIFLRFKTMSSNETSTARKQVATGRLTCARCTKRQIDCLPLTATKGAQTKCEGCRLAMVPCLAAGTNAEKPSQHKLTFPSLGFESTTSRKSRTNICFKIIEKKLKFNHKNNSKRIS